MARQNSGLVLGSGGARVGQTKSGRKAGRPAACHDGDVYSKWIALSKDAEATTMDLQKACKEFQDIAKKYGLTPADRKQLEPAGISGVRTSEENSDDVLAQLLAARQG